MTIRIHNNKNTFSLFTFNFNVSILLWHFTYLRVLENGVLRRMCGPKKDEVTGEWLKLHKGQLSDPYSSSTIIRVVKSRIMR